MAARKPGEEPDPAAELLGRWQAHHSGETEQAAAATPREDPEPSASGADETDAGDVADPEASAPPTTTPASTPAPSGPRHAAPRAKPGQRRTPAARGFDQTEAGREVVEALGIAPPPEPVEAEPAATEAEAPARPAKMAAPAPATVGETTDVEFPPRAGLRRILGLLLLVFAVGAVGAGYYAYDDPNTLTLGVAATLITVTLLMYALRASSTPWRLAIHSGQLEVVRGSNREVFDLTSRFTRMEVVGRPGRRGWKVLMGRFGRDPLVIDSSMVDPLAFTAALERHRPS